MTDSPRLETERLILRVPQLGDFERYAALLADEEACRFIGGHMPRPAAWRRFLQMPGAWAVQGVRWALTGRSRRRRALATA